MGELAGEKQPGAEAPRWEGAQCVLRMEVQQGASSPLPKGMWSEGSLERPSTTALPQRALKASVGSLDSSVSVMSWRPFRF